MPFSSQLEESEVPRPPPTYKGKGGVDLFSREEKANATVTFPRFFPLGVR